MTQPQPTAWQQPTATGDGSMAASMELLLSGLQQSVSSVQQTMQQGQLSVQQSVENMRTDMAKLITHMERVDTRNESADKLHADHENRLRLLEKIDAEGIRDMELRLVSLERFKYKMLGGSGVIGVLCGIGGALLEAWLARH